MCQFFSQCSQAPIVGVSGYLVSGNSSYLIGFWQLERTAKRKRGARTFILTPPFEEHTNQSLGREVGGDTNSGVGINNHFVRVHANPENIAPASLITIALGDEPCLIYRDWETAYRDWETAYRDWETAYRDWETDRKSTRLNSSHLKLSRMPSSA